MNLEKEIIKEFKRILSSSPESEWKVRQENNWMTWRIEKRTAPFIFVEKYQNGYSGLFAPTFEIKIGQEYGETIFLNWWDAFLIGRAIGRIKNYWIKIKKQEIKEEESEYRKIHQEGLVRVLDNLKKV